MVPPLYFQNLIISVRLHNLSGESLRALYQSHNSKNSGRVGFGRNYYSRKPTSASEGPLSLENRYGSAANIKRLVYAHFHVGNDALRNDADFATARWCKPGTISPSSWITGFSDNAETFFCAISGSQADLSQKMEEHCCKGPLHESGDGCYHWCTPSHAKKRDDWATCIEEHVYTDTMHFGQSCNSVGDLEVKNMRNNDREVRPGPKPNAGVPLSISWKLGVYAAAVVLIQAIF